MIYVVQLHTLRTRILILLDGLYPKRMDEVEISHCVDIKWGDAAIRRELYYLAEKGLIATDRAEGERLHAALTAKGRDFLTGDVEEVGLVSASDLGYMRPSTFG